MKTVTVFLNVLRWIYTGGWLVLFKWRAQKHIVRDTSGRILNQEAKTFIHKDDDAGNYDLSSDVFFCLVASDLESTIGGGMHPLWMLGGI